MLPEKEASGSQRSQQLVPALPLAWLPLALVLGRASPLVAALKSGDWVLLDNANSAPPETLERLNSLLEEERFLSVFESGDGVVYKDGVSTDDLIPGVVAIHSEFRIFVTANTRRVLSNRLSAAFLNRMVSAVHAPTRGLWCGLH